MIFRHVNNEHLQGVMLFKTPTLQYSNTLSFQLSSLFRIEDIAQAVSQRVER